MSYDTVPKSMKRIATPDEQTQLILMMSSLPLDKTTPIGKIWVDNIVANAQRQGISIAVTDYTPFGEDKAHTYILLSPNRDTMKKMVETGFRNIPEWIERSKSNGRGTLLMDRVAIDISHIDRHNYLQLNSMVMRQIQDMSIVKQAFLNEGYPLPDYVNAHTVHSIWELDQMRANQSVPAEVRVRYEETYKKAIADYAQMYCDKHKDVIADITHRGRHQVPESYFKENHVPLTWEIVNQEFYKYIEKELKKGRFPEFIYYKADKAFLKTKNLAKLADKLGISADLNFWKGNTGRKEYHICFPATQEHIFYTLMNEYNTRNMEHKKTVDDVLALATTNEPTQLIYIPINDIYNWDRLCTANNVTWAIDDGTMLKRPINDHDVSEAIPVIYPHQDIRMVNAIVARLTKEIRDYTPTSTRTQVETRTRSIQAVAERVNNRAAQNGTER